MERGRAEMRPGMADERTNKIKTGPCRGEDHVHPELRFISNSV